VYACNASWGVTLPEDAAKWEANCVRDEKLWAQK
jgi:hypothetical protein